MCVSFLDLVVLPNLSKASINVARGNIGLIFKSLTKCARIVFCLRPSDYPFMTSKQPCDLHPDVYHSFRKDLRSGAKCFFHTFHVLRYKSSLVRREMYIDGVLFSLRLTLQTFWDWSRSILDQQKMVVPIHQLDSKWCTRLFVTQNHLGSHPWTVFWKRSGTYAWRLDEPSVHHHPRSCQLLFIGHWVVSTTMGSDTTR